jgi:hypothetical protein
VGATLSACGALPSTRSERLRARWGYEAGSLALQGGVAHTINNYYDIGNPEDYTNYFIEMKNWGL